MAYVLDAYVLFNSEIVQLQNIVTEQLYSKVLFEILVIFAKLGNNIFHKFVKERIQPESKKSIFHLLKAVLPKSLLLITSH